MGGGPDLQNLVKRRSAVERRLRIVGFVLLWLVILGFTAWVFWLLPMDDACPAESSLWQCLGEGRLPWHTADNVGLVLLGFSLVSALWWGLIGFHRFRTEKIRQRSILSSPLPGAPAPQPPGTTDSAESQKLPPWRPGHLAVLMTAVIVGIAIAAPTIVGFVVQRHYLRFIFTSNSNWQRPSFPWLVMGLLLTLACLAVIWRILWLRRDDHLNAEHLRSINSLSDEAAIAVLRPKEPTMPTRSKARGFGQQLRRFLTWGPAPRRSGFPLRTPSTQDLTRLYTLELGLRFTAYAVIPLAILIGLSSNYLYDHRKCLDYDYWPSGSHYCVEYDPSSTTWSRVAGVVCFFFFIVAVGLWWRSLVVQSQAKQLEQRLADYERVRASNEGLGLKPPNWPTNPAGTSGARGGS